MDLYPPTMSYKIYYCRYLTSIFIIGICSFAYGISTLPPNPNPSEDSFLYTVIGGSLIVCVPLSCIRWYYYELYCQPVRVADSPIIQKSVNKSLRKIRSAMKSSKPAADVISPPTEQEQPYQIHPLIVVREPRLKTVELI